MPNQIVNVRLDHLIDALEARAKMSRAPDGSRSFRLREAAIQPINNTLNLAMPGKDIEVEILSGHLSEEVIFPTKHLPELIKVLRSYTGEQTEARLEISVDFIMFRCAGSRRTIPRIKP